MGRRRLASIAVATALAAGVVAVSAGASSSAGRPPGSPDLAAMALAVADLPQGTRVTRQRYYRDRDFVASYEREFSLGGSRVGRSSLLAVFQDLGVEPDTADAAATFVALRALLRTRAFRSALAREIAGAAGSPLTSVVVSRPRTARIGNGAVSIHIRMKAERVPFQAAMSFLRVERVLSVLAVVGFPARTVRNADVDRLVRVSAERIRAGLVPAFSAPPVIAGAVEHGRTLTASPGTSSGDQLAFSYQWERCVEPSTGCTPIPGATAATYTLVDSDLASSIRVTVSIRNGLGSATASSVSTRFVVGPPGAPMVTAGPVVEGVVGPGAVLTATTGTWTESPTSFAFQWRRCSPTTGTCVDISGATEAAHTLTAADSGSFIRVLVVATNAAGSGGALSAPSAPAP